MVANKLTDVSSYEEFVSLIENKSYTNKELNTKKHWFKSNNIDNRYDEIILWLERYLADTNSKTKITYDKAKFYMDKYGASEAVRQLYQREGIKITRQGLYAAVKRGEV